MKKLIIAAFAVASIGLSAQVSVGVRANALFNTSSATWEKFSGTVNEALDSKGKNSAGFNVGLSSKIDLPAVSLFLMPEIYYTSFSNETTAGATTLKAKSNRIDVPVLLGYNIVSLLGTNVNAFVGPVASYNLSKDETFGSFRENAANEFTVGYQFGASVGLKSLIVNARYEGAFSKDSRSFINSTGAEIRYDNRPSFFILGLGYQF